MIFQSISSALIRRAPYQVVPLIEVKLLYYLKHQNITKKSKKKSKSSKNFKQDGLKRISTT